MDSNLDLPASRWRPPVRGVDTNSESSHLAKRRLAGVLFLPTQMEGHLPTVAHFGAGTI